MMWKKIIWLFEGYRRYKYVLSVLVFVTPIYALIYMAQPLVMRYVIDVIEQGHASLPIWLSFLEHWTHSWGYDQTVGAVVSLVLFAFATFIVYIYLQNHRAWMNSRLEWSYRQRTFDATTQMGPDFFNHFRSGDLVTRMTDDVAEKLSWFACSGIFRFYEAVCLVIFGVIMMLSLNTRLTLYAVLPLPILIVIFSKTSALLDKRFDYLQTRISNFNNLMESCFSGIRVVKAYNRQDLWKNKFRTTIADRRKAEIDAVKAMAGIESLYGPIWQVGIIIVLVVGGGMVIKGAISYGDLVAFFFYVTMLTFPMFDIGQFLVKGRQSAVSIGRLMEVENFPPMVRDGNHSEAEVRFNEIKFDRVSFKFSGGDRKLVDSVTFNVCKGETVALVGKVGSGKSTILNLLTRVVDPSGGEIRLDHESLKEIPLYRYRETIGYVPQEPILFSESIEDNIRFGDTRIPPERIDEVIQLSQLESQLVRFPKGLQTRIGSRGMTISGGEKQRVAIARALVRDPKILILDDCTSALDARTEEKLWDALHEVMPEMTCFVVTHRTKTLRKVDKILLFDEGHLIDCGKHDELMARAPIYRELYSRRELEEEVGLS